MEVSALVQSLGLASAARVERKASELARQLRLRGDARHAQSHTAVAVEMAARHFGVKLQRSALVKAACVRKQAFEAAFASATTLLGSAGGGASSRAAPGAPAGSKGALEKLSVAFGCDPSLASVARKLCDDFHSRFLKSMSTPMQKRWLAAGANNRSIHEAAALFLAAEFEAERGAQGSGRRRRIKITEAKLATQAGVDRKGLASKIRHMRDTLKEAMFSNDDAAGDSPSDAPASAKAASAKAASAKAASASRSAGAGGRPASGSLGDLAKDAKERRKRVLRADKANKLQIAKGEGDERRRSARAKTPAKATTKAAAAPRKGRKIIAAAAPQRPERPERAAARRPARAAAGVPGGTDDAKENRGAQAEPARRPKPRAPPVRQKRAWEGVTPAAAGDDEGYQAWKRAAVAWAGPRREALEAAAAAAEVCA